MVSLIFKYENKKPLDFVIPKSLEGYIEFLTHSRISEFPVYRTTNGLEFEKDIRTILNERNINELKIILRRKKIEKIIKKENLILSLSYEFLNFWYNNYEDLFVLLPMEESVKF